MNRFTRHNFKGWCDESVIQLVWLGFLFLPLLGDRSLSFKVLQFDLNATLLAILAYLPLHFYSYYRSGRPLWLAQAATFMLGTWLLPYNYCAHTLWLYAGLPGERASRREAISGMLIVALAAFVVAQIYDLPGGYMGLFSGLLFGIGFAILGQHESRDNKLKLLEKDLEIARLAKLAERERIARDMHDLLGHTLSLIALKSELAHKLVTSNPQRAVEEMVAVTEVARSALSEVRQTISGLRSISLSEALERACVSLRSANLGVDVQWCALPTLDRATEHALAQGLLEASTNILRHAAASRVVLGLAIQADSLQLRIRDDGGGLVQDKQGNGLSGMRERMDAVGGSLQVMNLDSGVEIKLCVSVRDLQAIQLTS